MSMFLSAIRISKSSLADFGTRFFFKTIDILLVRLHRFLIALFLHFSDNSLIRFRMISIS